MTPGSFSLVTCVTSVGFCFTDMIYCVWMFFPNVKIFAFLDMEKHFPYFGPFFSIFRPNCILILSFSFLIAEYNFASSVNSLIQQFKTSGISFINMRKSIGPGTLLWGIPDVTFLHSDRGQSEGSISSVWEIIFGVLLSEGSISSVLEITFSVLLSEGSISSVLEITFSVLLSEGSGILLFEGSNICGVDKVFIFKEDLLLFEGSIYQLKELI